MATFYSRNALVRIIFLVFCLCFSDFGILQEVTSLGINYGQLGDNLLPPEKVLDLLTSLKITKARIYDTNPEILTAFANSSVELIVTIENAKLGELSDPDTALEWVSTRIKPYVPATKITSILVGNEVYTGDGETELLDSLVPAMVNIHGALKQLRLDSNIKVSTPCSFAVFEESYPPSAGSFRSEISDAMSELLKFLSSTKAPFWINAYPFFAYQSDPKTISLDYVLFNPSKGIIDPSNNLHYDNMLYAQVDATISAIAKLGFDDIEVKVAETGWPSNGDDNENGADLQNAATYNGNLVKRQLEKEGTPLRPKTGLEVYIFALFNENMKPGPTSERNFGLFQPDGTKAYDVGFSGTTTPASPAPISTNSSSTTPPSPPNSVSTNTSTSPSDPTGGLTFASGATKSATMGFQQSLVFWMFACMHAADLLPSFFCLRRPV